MILWIYKLTNSARRAFAGRKYPHQLAWAVAFGILLGVIPHGNLLALLVLLVVLSLKLNHAMAGLTAVGTTFLATYLDPYSHQVGEAALSHPEFREAASKAWQLPLVPWTDLNNTVVLGSFLIGVTCLLPVFGLTYPLFRLFAPSQGVKQRSMTQRGTDPQRSRSTTSRQILADAEDVSPPLASDVHQVVMIDQGHVKTKSPHSPNEANAQKPPRWTDPPADQVSPRGNAETCEVEFIEVDSQPTRQPVSVETRIDVIRMKDHRSARASDSRQVDDAENEQPMDEALNYLLRQLRDSQQKQRKAA